MNALVAAERKWLSPMEDRPGNCLCWKCSEKPRSPFFTISGHTVCQPCVEEATVCLDFDDPVECTECGETCDEWITLALGEALCPECLNERRIIP